VILSASLLALNKASDLTITNSVKVADITGLGKTTVGFLLLAFSTSLPELFVSIFSALEPDSIGVAIGNVLGSNIANICLILGICFLSATWKSSNNVKLPSSMATEEARSLYFGLFIASVIPLTLIYMGYASRFIGVILLTIFVFNTLQLSRKKTIREEGSSGEEKQKLRKYMVVTFSGAAGVVVSSFFIESASYIAVSIGIPRVVIGATIVAFGTKYTRIDDKH